MKIALIQPYAGNHPPSFLAKLSSHLPQNPNLTLQQLAGIIPQEHEIVAIDENRGNRVRFNAGYDVACITCNTAAAPRAYALADECRRHGIKVILGGYHPTAVPKEAQAHADCVIAGEAEISLPEALSDISRSSMQPFYRHDPVDPALIPPARRDVIDYLLPIAAMEATRGCPINCAYCFVQNVKGSRYRERPLDNVLDEIESIRQRHLMFYDASLTMDPSYTKTLFRRMAGLNKHFTCYGNINVLGKDHELLRLAREAGCMNWCIGFEAISQGIIDSVGKSTNKVQEYIQAARSIKDHGMNLTGSFIFGFDNHSKSSFQETKAMIDKLDLSIACINVLTPFPGTPIYRKLEAEGRLTCLDWSQYTCSEPVFQPKLMTEQELYDGSIWILDEFYSLWPIVKRVWRSTRFGFQPFIDCVQGNGLYYTRKIEHLNHRWRKSRRS
jgi:radical SAM superfamily enzyme YgiQ (UPF0313 family)